MWIFPGTQRKRELCGEGCLWEQVDFALFCKGVLSIWCAIPHDVSPLRFICTSWFGYKNAMSSRKSSQISASIKNSFSPRSSNQFIMTSKKITLIVPSISINLTKKVLNGKLGTVGYRSKEGEALVWRNTKSSRERESFKQSQYAMVRTKVYVIRFGK